MTSRGCGSRSFPLLLITFAVCLAGPPVSAQETGNIVGQMVLINGSPPSDRVLVTLTTRGATVDSIFCDGEGHFAFYNLIGNPYHIVIDEEGYQHYEQLVILNPKLQETTVVHIVLRASEKPPTENSPGSDSSGNPFAVDVSSYVKKFPPEVRQEFDAGVKSDHQGKPDEAIRHYMKAIELAPDFYPAHRNLGTLYVGKGDLEAAENEFTQVIKLNQSDAQAYFDLGNVFYRTKRYDDAKRTLQEGLRHQPNSALAYFLFGCISIREGELTVAEQQLHTALEFDPRMHRVHLELANVYLLQQKTSDAIKEMKTFVKSSPHDPLLPKVKEALVKLESPQAPPH